MIRLELTEKEARTLHRVIDTSLSELSGEIADTDSFEYRQILKERGAVLRKVRGALAGALPPEPAAPP